VCHRAVRLTTSQEKLISDREVLLAAAAKVGLPADGAAAVLDDPQAHAAEVQEQVERAAGVGGVPFFVIDKK
jgi:predicted DsbA family dithiol-disulfide isomerase